MIVNITESEIREVVKDAVMNCLKYKSNSEYGEKETVNEGLITTYSLPKVFRIIDRRFDRKKMRCILTPIDMNSESEYYYDIFKMGSYMRNSNDMTTQDGDSWFMFKVSFPEGFVDFKREVMELIRLCRACGWFFAYMETQENRNGKLDNVPLKNINFDDDAVISRPVSLIFRAKYNKGADRKSLPQYVYHIAPMRVAHRISINGLQPRSNGRTENHPERVYLYIEKPNPKVLNDIVTAFKESGRDEPYELLTIDLSKVNNDIRFYYDSNTYRTYPKAIYCLETIPRSAIVKFENIINH